MSTMNDDPPYAMAAAGGEVERLKLQSDLLRLSMNGLFFAPIDFTQGGLKILDSGTADGAWLHDLYACLTDPSKHEFVGTDLETRWFKEDVPANMSFLKQDITEEWPQEWTERFDFVHQRLVLAGVRNQSPQQSVSNLVRLVKPGGWVEIYESDMENKLNNGPAMRRWMELASDFFVGIGAPKFVFKDVDTWLTESGLEAVESRHVDIKYGAKNETVDMVEMSIKSLLLAALGITTAVKNLNISTDVKYDDLLPALEQELRQEGAIFRQRVIMGRKPAK